MPEIGLSGSTSAACGSARDSARHWASPGSAGGHAETTPGVVSVAAGLVGRDTPTTRTRSATTRRVRIAPPPGDRLGPGYGLQRALTRARCDYFICRVGGAGGFAACAAFGRRGRPGPVRHALRP